MIVSRLNKNEHLLSLLSPFSVKHVTVKRCIKNSKDQEGKSFVEQLFSSFLIVIFCIVLKEAIFASVGRHPLPLSATALLI